MQVAQAGILNGAEDVGSYADIPVCLRTHMFLSFPLPPVINFRLSRSSSKTIIDTPHPSHLDLVLPPTTGSLRYRRYPPLTTFNTVPIASAPELPGPFGIRRQLLPIPFILQRP